MVFQKPILISISCVILFHIFAFTISLPLRCLVVQWWWCLLTNQVLWVLCCLPKNSLCHDFGNRNVKKVLKTMGRNGSIGKVGREGTNAPPVDLYRRMVKNFQPWIMLLRNFFFTYFLGVTNCRSRNRTRKRKRSISRSSNIKVKPKIGRPKQQNKS